MVIKGFGTLAQLIEARKQMLQAQISSSAFVEGVFVKYHAASFSDKIIARSGPSFHAPSAPIGLNRCPH